MSKSLVTDIQFAQIPNFKDERGGLSVVESGYDFPFQIARVFYTYDTNSMIKRGSHAHKTCWQMLICLNGFMEVECSDSLSNKSFELNSPNKGLLIPPMIWSTQFGYSKGAICLVLASEIYSEDEYIRNFDDFILLK